MLGKQKSKLTIAEKEHAKLEKKIEQLGNMSPGSQVAKYIQEIDKERAIFMSKLNAYHMD